MVESGFFTGMIIYISLWYCKKEQIMRFSILFGAVCAAGVFDGIIVCMLWMSMESIVVNVGIRGLEKWRWLFLLEGSPSILLGVITYLFFGSLPESV